MSRTESQSVPHVDEAYRLAQLLASDRTEAAAMVVAAFEMAGPGRGARFAVLSALLRSAQAVGAAVGSGSEAVVGAEPGAAVRSEPGSVVGPWTAVEPGSASASGPDPEPDATRPSLMSAYAGRPLVGRIVPIVLARMARADRATIWLDAAGISNAADLGAVLGVSAPEALQRLVVCRTRLNEGILAACSPVERSLAQTVLRNDSPRELVRHILDSLLEPAPSSLHDRLRQTEAPGAPTTRRAPRRALAGGVLRVASFVVTAGLVGYGIYSFRPPVPASDALATDLVTMAVEVADEVRPAFRATGAEQAEVFIFDRIGWRVVVPAIRARGLEGVGVHVFGGGTETPALIYGGPEPLTVFVFTYAFLDRLAPSLSIDRGILDQIADDGQFSVIDEGRRRALIFRHRDDIYVAVTVDDPVGLRDAVSFPD